jgi:hypothetical protein
MQIETGPGYFRIWRSAFRILGRHGGLLLWATLLFAAPFFALNGLINANHMMTLGGAAMAGEEIPLEEMRLLWGSLVLGDSLAFIMLTIAALLILTWPCDIDRPAFKRHLRREVPRLLLNPWFWLFALVQIVLFAMINTPDGRFKLSGMALVAVSILMLWSSHDRAAPAYGKRLRELSAKTWLSLFFVVLTFPLLYILFNGYLGNALLLLVDLAGQQIMPLAPASIALPVAIITLAKFLASWLNLVPMCLLLSAYLATREGARAQ